MKCIFRTASGAGGKMQAIVHVNNTSIPAFLFSSRLIDEVPSGLINAPVLLCAFEHTIPDMDFSPAGLFLCGKFCGTDES
jgi:hypothetical protein